MDLNGCARHKLNAVQQWDFKKLERPKAISSGNTVRKDPHVVLSLKTSSDLFCVNIGISV